MSVSFEAEVYATALLKRTNTHLQSLFLRENELKYQWLILYSCLQSFVQSNTLQNENAHPSNTK